ncbi:DUF4381 domain-containing protein [Aliidiomarina indica]|uniref:DUF4381 domain-containing protein n=1 Tax=Aliidiomarina indica TaxID=2749147 RepID=UPI0018908C7C|nr:DUF4381 domain-containing protein [Aliidiomarina indica]
MNPLDQLHDIVPPEPVGWWPLAWGWWVLIVILLVAGSIVLWRTLSRYSKLRPQRLVLAQLQQPHSSLTQVNITLKRGLLMANGNTPCAHLHGDDWFDYLVTSLPSRHQADFQAQLAPFRDRLYQAHQADDVTRYQALIRQWAQRSSRLEKGGGHA